MRQAFILHFVSIRSEQHSLLEALLLDYHLFLILLFACPLCYAPCIKWGQLCRLITKKRARKPLFSK